MRCSSRVTVYHLKRFLLGKLSVPPLYDVSYNGGEPAYRSAKINTCTPWNVLFYSLSFESLTAPFCISGCTASHCIVGNNTMSSSAAEGSGLVLHITFPLPPTQPHPLQKSQSSPLQSFSASSFYCLPNSHPMPMWYHVPTDMIVY